MQNHKTTTDVTPLLISAITNSSLSKEEKSKVLVLIQQRYEYGMKKYGRCLNTLDGRDDVVDAMEELGDLLQYTYKAKLNGNLSKLKEEMSPCLKMLEKILKEK